MSLIGICGVLDIVVIIVLITGSEVPVIGTCSRFFSAVGVFALAFSALLEP